MVPHHPETLPLPLVIAACLTNRITEHVVSGVFFLQTVPEEQKKPFRPEASDQVDPLILHHISSIYDQHKHPAVSQRPSPLQGFLHQLLRTGLGGGQHALVVGPLTDVAAEDLQDSGDRHLTGQLSRVVCGQEVARQRLAAPPRVPQVGALFENS